LLLVPAFRGLLPQRPPSAQIGSLNIWNQDKTKHKKKPFFRFSSPFLFAGKITNYGGLGANQWCFTPALRPVATTVFANKDIVIRE
jgi:hypothetical protein